MNMPESRRPRQPSCLGDDRGAEEPGSFEQLQCDWVKKRRAELEAQREARSSARMLGRVALVVACILLGGFLMALAAALGRR